jgi:hypothetical protein
MKQMAFRADQMLRVPQPAANDSANGAVRKFRMHHKKSPSGDAVWHSAEQIGAAIDGEVFSPQVLMSSSGNAVAVWHHYDGRNSSIWANHYSTLAGWARARRIDQHFGAAQHAHLAVNAAGHAIVVWQQPKVATAAQLPNLCNEVWMSICSPEKGWAVPTLIDTNDEESNTALGAADPKVALAPDGVVLVVWQRTYADDDSRTSIAVNRWVPGAGWSGAICIDTNDGHCGDASVVIDANDNALVTWLCHKSAQCSVWSSNSSKGRWAAAQRLDMGQHGIASQPHLAMNKQGQACVIWEQFLCTRYIIWACKFEPAVGWSLARRVETLGNYPHSYPTYPQITIDTQGQAVALWLRTESGRSYMWTSQYLPSGGWGSSRVACENADDVHIANHSEGMQLAVWRCGSKLLGNASYVAEQEWSSTVLLDEAGYQQRVAVSANGNAVAIWVRTDKDGQRNTVWASGFHSPKAQPIAMANWLNNAIQ